MAATASPLAVAADASLADYWRFHRAVATAQLAAWLPLDPQFLVDISGPHGRSAAQAARAGHNVLRVDAEPPAAGPRREPERRRPGHCHRRSGPSSLPGRWLRGWRDRRRPHAVALHRGGVPGRRDRPGAQARRPHAGQRRFTGAGHGRAGRAASLGGADRRAERGGPAASRGRTARSPAATALRTCGTCARRRGWNLAWCGRGPCCRRPWSPACCTGTGRRWRGWSRQNSPRMPTNPSVSSSW